MRVHHTGPNRGNPLSDGTGSSSAKLMTNVWRLYEAVDLTPPIRAVRKRSRSA